MIVGSHLHMSLSSWLVTLPGITNVICRCDPFILFSFDLAVALVLSIRLFNPLEERGESHGTTDAAADQIFRLNRRPGSGH